MLYKHDNHKTHISYERGRHTHGDDDVKRKMVVAFTQNPRQCVFKRKTHAQIFKKIH